MQVCIKKIAALKQTVPDLHLQMTTESVAGTAPKDMRKVTEEVMCEGCLLA